MSDIGTETKPPTPEESLRAKASELIYGINGALLNNGAYQTAKQEQYKHDYQFKNKKIDDMRFSMGNFVISVKGSIQDSHFEIAIASITPEQLTEVKKVWDRNSHPSGLPDPRSSPNLTEQIRVIAKSDYTPEQAFAKNQPHFKESEIYYKGPLSNVFAIDREGNTSQKIIPQRNNTAAADFISNTIQRLKSRNPEIPAKTPIPSISKPQKAPVKV